MAFAAWWETIAFAREHWTFLARVSCVFLVTYVVYCGVRFVESEIRDRSTLRQLLIKGLAPGSGVRCQPYLRLRGSDEWMALSLNWTCVFWSELFFCDPT
jgi:hypothetical protein